MKQFYFFTITIIILALLLYPTIRRKRFDHAFDTASAAFEESLVSLCSYRDPDGYISQIIVTTSFYDS